MTIAEISKMSVLERLQTMEALWDSLTREPTGKTGSGRTPSSAINLERKTGSGL